MRCLGAWILGVSTLFGSSTGFADWRHLWRPAPRGVNKILLLSAPQTGEMNSRLAIAEKFPRAELKIVESAQAKSEVARFGYPDLIVHSFSQPAEAELILSLKRKSRGQTYAVNIEDPGPRRGEYDLIVNAEFNPPIVGENVLKTAAVPSRVTDAVLDRARDEFGEQFAHLARPLIFVIVGGQTPTKTFTSHYARELSQRVTRLVRETGGTLIVTNSARSTEPSTRAFLSAVSGVPFFFYDWLTAKGENNPYLGMLAYADYIVATGDSLSMLSDVTQTGKPVFVYAPETTVEERHQRFIVNLYRAGRVKPFTNELEHWTYAPADTAQQIFRRIERDRQCSSFLSVGSD